MFLKMFWHPRENAWPSPLAAGFRLREKVKGWDLMAGVDSGEEVPGGPRAAAQLWGRLHDRGVAWPYCPGL